jgi:hypothetical protein
MSISIRVRLERIDKQIAAFGGPEIPDELSQLRARMFEPTIEEEHAAIISILETMPEEYARQVIDELNSLADLPEEMEWKPTPLTARVMELAQLRIYECPRPLAVPEAFCRAYMALEPGQWLETWADTCEDCLLAHLVLFWREGRQEKFRRIFDKCVLCGGKLGWEFLSPASRPCHDSTGSLYGRALRNGGWEILNNRARHAGG